MEDISKKVFSKAEAVLFLDKVKSPSKIKDVLSSEIFYVLKQFFDIAPASFRSEIHTNLDGTIDIDFSFKADRILIKK